MQLEKTSPVLARKRAWRRQVKTLFGLPTEVRDLDLSKIGVSTILKGFLLTTMIIGPCVYVSYTSYFAKTEENGGGRLLLGSDDCYPNAVSPGIAVLCVLGILYMFIALALVVDEFFIPPLEAISGQVGMSNDVAGATLMAAGGSAPELFTSFIGTFQKSDVGFAAIVGSAVFNVLFVIGCCAFASPEPLDLTWWPLARDCTFYAVGLGLLSVFFIGSSPEEIYHYEAAILLFLYFCYVGFMKYNLRVSIWVERKLGRGRNLDAAPNKDMPVKSKTQVDLEEVQLKAAEKRANDERPQARGRAVSVGFRAGMLSFLMKDTWELDEAVSIQAVTQVLGNVEETFNTIDADGNGFIEKDELAQLLGTLSTNGKCSDEHCAEVLKTLDSDGDGKISFEEFSKWYLKSEDRIKKEMRELFTEFDFDSNDSLSSVEVRALLVESGLTESESKEAAKKAFADAGLEFDTDGMSFEQFDAWYVKTEHFKQKLKVAEHQAEETEGLDLSIPPSIKGKFWWILTIPLLVLFKFTIPDVRIPGRAKWSPVAFFIAIIWIGVFSWFMVDWAQKVGDTLHIPIVVMGLTFLAAGTSVPDLLSSMIVAKQGHGDMAVSSSIGSNIFDILVGLPLPWLSYNLIIGETVKVGADNLGISVAILLFMVILVIVSIICAKWKMTKALGGFMFVMYFAFVGQDLARSDWSC